MARRKKRTKRGKRFGGTEVQHREGLANALRWGVQDVRFAMRATNAGNCEKALMDLSNAERMSGAAVAEAKWASDPHRQRVSKSSAKNTGTRVAKLQRVVRKAQVAFFNKCVK